jgi:hypothetical protein
VSGEANLNLHYSSNLLTINVNAGYPELVAVDEAISSFPSFQASSWRIAMIKLKLPLQILPYIRVIYCQKIVIGVKTWTKL